jgi:hypothetical protein
MEDFRLAVTARSSLPQAVWSYSRLRGMLPPAQCRCKAASQAAAVKENLWASEPCDFAQGIKKKAPLSRGQGYHQRHSPTSPGPRGGCGKVTLRQKTMRSRKQRSGRISRSARPPFTCCAAFKIAPPSRHSRNRMRVHPRAGGDGRAITSVVEECPARERRSRLRSSPSPNEPQARRWHFQGATPDCPRALRDRPQPTIRWGSGAALPPS